ncbi:hypothetical protein FOZ60_007678 [Perkinsus olseni]|uniref:Uncharacterized protein n=1 Tax=Perkinsus olseni TaxID=32597 RepID=A0A7J6NLM4_PEROL|nr:hypothetical protein FOZ60_007678 [Perkinsus olseni]
MWTGVQQFFCLYALGSSGKVTSKTSLNFYKELERPWVIKEWPYYLGTTQPPPDYTWDEYFDYLLALDTRHFVFGGYEVIYTSEIVEKFIWPPRKNSTWNEGKFRALKSLGGGSSRNFNKTLFGESLTRVLSKFPIHGILHVLPATVPNWANLDEATKIIREMMEILKCLGLDTALRFRPGDWPRMLQQGLGKIADMYFAPLLPSCDPSKPAFDTNAYAEEIIKSSTGAGVDPKALVITMPLILESIGSNDCFVPAGVGYSYAVVEEGVDPAGNGTFSAWNMTNYFLSQPRAIEKIGLAESHGLNGLMLRGDDGGETDLYPWDDRSLFYALATNI